MVGVLVPVNLRITYKELNGVVFTLTVICMFTPNCKEA